MLISSNALARGAREGRGWRGGGGKYLSRLRMAHCLEADVVDEHVREVIAGRGERQVDFARQVGELVVALAVVSDHVVDLCSQTQCKVRAE